MNPLTALLAAAGMWFAVLCTYAVATVPFAICLALAWAAVTGTRRANRARKERT
ncbi:hypothetical protein OG875_05190 [Streptomyces sp. NBC_01498]|uniref:hypothetical protein n=1 Tax=Streptomyces sp. NBC_01498 TaxID=2975870 RepID=UPI002E7C066C|nr:hypothetical protein [Streptomyces sp. NBC_01498]WTL24053.1 hypothetical protein OG875_05190 [Streptomyces sp. NBC_01498]